MQPAQRSIGDHQHTQSKELKHKRPHQAHALADHRRKKRCAPSCAEHPHVKREHRRDDTAQLKSATAYHPQILQTRQVATQRQAHAQRAHGDPHRRHPANLRKEPQIIRTQRSADPSEQDDARASDRDRGERRDDVVAAHAV